MKYIKPTFELVELEISDIIAASSEAEQGSITVDDTTITGPKNNFSVDFGDL